MPHLHGFLPRSGESIPLGSVFQPGKFGRMFPNLAPHKADPVALEELGAAMKEKDSDINNALGDNENIPAGFTYLGQFIDHDITLDTSPLPEVRVDPLATHNFRTPQMDLDNIYGLGPVAHPFLYQRADVAKFLLGSTRGDGSNPPFPVTDEDTNPLPAREKSDLQRNTDGFALIGDPRNDENLIVAQLHLAFLKFHNKIVDHIRGGGPPKATDFENARRMVTWHFQWIVLHDFIGRLVESEVLEDVEKNGRRFYTFAREPFIPVEFSVAAYRLGHSMVRQEYDYNRVFNPSSKRLAAATFDLLFGFTGLSGPNEGLFKMPVPSNWIIDWRRFFDLERPPSTSPNAPTLNFSRKLDPLAAPQLHSLPLPAGEEKRLPVRNLIRGLRTGLPSGQSIAAAMRLPALTPKEIATGADGSVARKHGFDRSTPLWYYILKEAQIRHGGQRLGPVGSRILAEVFVGLLQGDGHSFASQSPEWKPTLPGAEKDDFTMVDLLNFLGPTEINPLGDPPGS